MSAYSSSRRSTPTASPPALAATPAASTSIATSPTAGDGSAAANTPAPRPLSEPEAGGAYGFIYLIRPDVTIWFHQPFGLIDRPDGNPFAAQRFSQLIGLPFHRLRGPYPGSASRWQTHAFPWSTGFVAELPERVSGTLVRRGAAAVRTLAVELASPELGQGSGTTPAAGLRGAG